MQMTNLPSKKSKEKKDFSIIVTTFKEQPYRAAQLAYYDLKRGITSMSHHSWIPTNFLTKMRITYHSRIGLRKN